MGPPTPLTVAMDGRAGHTRALAGSHARISRNAGQYLTAARAAAPPRPTTMTRHGETGRVLPSPSSTFRLDDAQKSLDCRVKEIWVIVTHLGSCFFAFCIVAFVCAHVYFRNRVENAVSVESSRETVTSLSSIEHHLLCDRSRRNKLKLKLKLDK